MGKEYMKGGWKERKERKTERKKERKTERKKERKNWAEATHQPLEWCYSFRCRFYSLSYALRCARWRPSVAFLLGFYRFSNDERDWRHIFVVFFSSSSSSFFHSRFPTSPNPGPTLHQLFFFKYKIQTGWKIPVEIPTLQRENTPRDCVCVFVTQRSMAIRGFRRQKKKKLYHTTSILIWYGKN